MSDAPPEDNNIFRTKDGYAIALQPWTVMFITAHVEQIVNFLGAFVGLTQGGITGEDAEGTKLPAVNPQHIADAIPALQRSCSNPDDFARIQGLKDLMRFAARVWEFNEIGVGLKEAHGLHQQIVTELVGAEPQS